MSSDPSQNSALAQDLANVDTQAQSLQANTLASAGTQLTQHANSLLQSGMSATQLSAQIPLLVQQPNSQISQQTAQTISSFSSAFGAEHSRSFQHKRDDRSGRTFASGRRLPNMVVKMSRLKHIGRRIPSLSSARRSSYSAAAWMCRGSRSRSRRRRKCRRLVRVGARLAAAAVASR
jgi:hypothetical protein